MKVAIVRGPSLNPWEMQSYGPLARTVELVGIGSKRGYYDVSRFPFPVVRLPCLGEYLSIVPRGIALLYKTMGDPRCLIGFDRVIRGFDIVHVAELRSYFSLQAIQAKRKGLVKAVTITVYENIAALGDEVSARRRIKEAVIRGADHFLAVSEGAERVLLEEGVEKGRISVVPEGVDTRRFTPREGRGGAEVGERKFAWSQKVQVDRSGPLDWQASPAQPDWPSDRRKFVHLPAPFPYQRFTGKAEISRGAFGLAEDEFVVLSVGRMVAEKGWGDILRAAQKVKSEKLKVKSYRRMWFLCVGEGPERKRFERMAEGLGLREMVVFPGGIGYDQMPELFRMADLFVLASRSTPVWQEQFGNVLIEAMATGLPIVGTKSGAIPEVVDEGGLLVEPGDAGGLAKEILRFAKDPKLCMEIGRGNRMRATETYDHRLIARKILTIWKAVLKKRG